MSNQIVTEQPLWKDGKNGNIQFLSSWRNLQKQDPSVFGMIEQREGFECEDIEYYYKVGKSKFGLWLSRKKKNSFTAPEPIKEPKNIKPDPRPLAFMVQQPQAETPQQQQHAAVVYPYSVKIETSSNGSAKVCVHTYNADLETAKNEAIRLFIETQEELKLKGVKVLESTQ